MLKYELKIALRKLLKSKLYTFLNVIGLAVGLAACLIIATIVLNDISYDKQWKNTNQLFKLTGYQFVNNAMAETQDIHAAMAPELMRNFPEVKGFCRVEIKQEKIKFNQSGETVDIRTLQTENTIWNLLDLTVVEGNPKQTKEGMDNVVITQQLRNEFYKNDDPVGKIIYAIGPGDTAKYFITGVIKDMPGNTHLRSHIIIFRSAFRQGNFNKLGGMVGATYLPQYLLLRPDADAAKFEKKITAWYKKYRSEELLDQSFHLQPIQDVYLRSNYPDSGGIHGNINTVYIFSVVAVLILLIACINYINLSTARAFECMREAAVSRVVGAETGHIMSRFLLESTLFFVAAFIIAVSAYAISLRFVEYYLNNILPLTLFNSIMLLGASILTLLIVCVVTGVYPAYILAKITPVYALKGAISEKPGTGLLKKALIVTQFTIALIVLIAAITINLQFRFLKNADPGYDKSNLLQIGFTNWGNTGNDFKKDLLRIAGVESASMNDWYPASPGFMGFDMPDPKNKNNTLHVSIISCDLDFPATLKLHLEAGRFFDPKRPAEAVADSLHYKKVLLSKSFEDAFQQSLDKAVPDFSHMPIGIVKGFHYESFLNREKPFIIQPSNDFGYSAMVIRVISGSDSQVAASLKQLWKQYYPAKTLTFNWVDDLLTSAYRKENKLGNIFNIFTCLAIFLACLGLFGLVTFTLERRMKEIGIRKVLGASVGSISALISKDFVSLVVIAALVASPVAWYFLNSWLQAYPYRVEVYWWIFVLGAVLMVIITLSTVSVKTIKAALANPVKSLRSE